MKKENISIIIPAYNCEKFIGNCLTSIKSSTYNDYEVIIVDDCSTDNTLKVAKVFGAKTLRLDKNMGPAYARNAGAKIALGNILFFADSDVEFLNNTLSEVAKAFTDAKIDVVTGIYSKEPVNKGIAPLYKALFMYYHCTKAKVENNNIFASSCGAIRKSVFKQLGGFNSSIKWGVDLENDEFGHRINKLYKNPIIPEIQVKHNFSNRRRLLKTMFKRTYYWTLYFFKKKEFNKVVSTPMMGIANALSPLIIFSFILAPLNKLFLNIAIFSFLVYLSAYLGFYKFLLREKKYKHLFPIVFVSFSVSVVVGIAAVFACIRKAINLIKGSPDKNELETVI